MRVWQLIGITLVLGVMSITTGWRPLFVVTYALIAALVLSSAWMALSLQGMSFSRTTPIARAQVGERMEERLALENRSWFPKLWVQVSDESTLPGHHAGYVSSLGAHKRITWRARTLCRQRGRYLLGPVSATTGDPLGLFQQTVPLAPAYPLLVLPTVLPLENFVLYPGAMPGRGRGSQRSLQTATNVVTVRTYVPGDPLTRIHWRSTARMGQFMVKEFDLDPTVDITILLDLDRRVQVGQDEQSTEEHGVTIAASIANYLLRQKQLAVGLVVSGMPEGSLLLDRGERQLDRILELLAIAHPRVNAPISEALALEAVHLARSSVLVVVTASTDLDWPEGIHHLLQRGVRPLVITLDPHSFDASYPDNHAVVEALTAVGVPLISVRYGDDLVALLSGAARERGYVPSLIST
ncbi:MAG TPA: DUF58 domain-containing protein [Ktedonobacterales bacterium]|nr:DUF58 domain-containing protein [Ktedonobacterales bacterium]